MEHNKKDKYVTVYQSATLGISRTITTCSTLLSNIIISHLGENEVASLPYISSLQALSQVTITAGLSPVGGLLVNEFNKNPESNRIKQIIRQTQAVGLKASVPIVILVFSACGLLFAIDINHEIAKNVLYYFVSYAATLPLLALTLPSQQLFIGTKYKVYAIISTLLTSALQLGFAYTAYKFDILPIPAVGLSFTISTLLRLISNEVVLFLVGHADKLSEMKNTSEKRFIINKGLPVAVQYFLEMLSIVLISFLTSLLESEDLRMRGITSMIISFLAPLVFAFSQGATYSVARTKALVDIGKRDISMIRKTAYVSTLFGTSIVATFLGALFISTDWYLKITGGNKSYFSDTQKDFMRKLILMAVSAQVLDSVRNISSGVLKGLANTRFSSSVSVIFRLVIKTSLAAILGLAFSEGLLGFSIANLVTLFLESIVMFIYMHYSTRVEHWVFKEESSTAQETYFQEVYKELCGLCTYMFNLMTESLCKCQSNSNNRYFILGKPKPSDKQSLLDDGRLIINYNTA